MFDIDKTNSFNADKLVDGTEYDYVTRTSFNQGILQTTGFVNKENINEKGTWSLGLLQMDFFYRQKPWYAGQFMRKISAKIDIPNNAILFFTVLLNKQKQKLLSVLVRDVDECFRNAKIDLPTKNGKIDFKFMEQFVAELEARHVAELNTYLMVTGLKDYHLTKQEEQALKDFDKLEWGEFDVTGEKGIFDVKNTGNILSSEIIANSGTTPYLCASAENNAVSSYIKYDENYLDRGNCIFIGGKTFVVTYQKDDFYSNDSHNLVLYLKGQKRNRYNQLYLVTCVYKSLCHKYSWGDSISGKKIKNDKVILPIKDGKICFDTMQIFISAVQKLVIKDVVLYSERKIKETKGVVKQTKEKSYCSEDITLLSQVANLDQKYNG